MRSVAFGILALIGVLEAGSAWALVIDNFEDGAFGPDSITTGVLQVNQTGIDPSNTIGGVRGVDIFLNSGTQATAELAVNGGDDAIVFTLQPDATSSSNALFDLEYGTRIGIPPGAALDADLTADGANRFEILVSAFSGGTGSISFALPGATQAFNLQLTGPGTYVFPFADFAGTPDLTDVDFLNVRFSLNAFEGNTQVVIQDFRTVPESRSVLLLALAASLWAASRARGYARAA